MQFVLGGPDIPERLLYAHEQGRVVFFCGAGVSRRAGLPLFEELVKGLFQAFYRQPVEDASSFPTAFRQALEDKNFDKAVTQLEKKAVGGKEAVLRELQKLLRPKKKDGYLATHEALLRLGQSKDGTLRLVTTNFDRLFEEAVTSLSDKLVGQRASYDEAPSLPDSGRGWEDVVYLHGLLPEEDIQIGGKGGTDRFVLSSADFGMGYHRNSRVSQFLSELFRSYSICFVGYTMDAPVRMIVDSITASQRKGENSPEIFAFCPSDDKAIEYWQSYEVTPIPYSDAHKHKALHKTLAKWGEVHSSSSGKEDLVAELAGADLSDEAVKDFAVDQMLWALSDPSGKPARRFANLDPLPPLKWLDFFSDARYGKADLERFRVSLDQQRVATGPGQETYEDLPFSLIDRPSPSGLSLRMSLVNRGHDGEGNLDDVMLALAGWLARHFDSPRLATFFAGRGGRLHRYMARELRWQLDRLPELEGKGEDGKPERSIQQAPNAIPSVAMRSLWEMFLAGLLAERSRPEYGLYEWREDLKRGGLSVALRRQMQALLSPRVSLGAPHQEISEDPQQVGDLFDCDIRLTATEDAHDWLRGVTGKEAWQAALPSLFDDFNGLLQEAYLLQEELGLLRERKDRSWLIPSIERGDLGDGTLKWSVLVDLVREAWLAVAKENPGRAVGYADGWRRVPYPLFQRLAFFAAAQEEVVPPGRGLDWLLSDGGHWLRSTYTMHEAIGLLVALAPRLSKAEQGRLEQAILSFPATEAGQGGGGAEERRAEEYAVWLRLAKLQAGGADLGADAKKRFSELSGGHPEWALDPEGKDTLAYHSEAGWVESPPIEREQGLEDLVDWLRKHPEESRRDPDDWEDRCRQQAVTSVKALCELASEGEEGWLTGRWETAMRVWREEKELAEGSWQHAAPSLVNAPDEKFLTLVDSGSLPLWMEEAAKLGTHNELFLQLASRILELAAGGRLQKESPGMVFPHEGPAVRIDDPVHLAINHPVGQITQTLYRWRSQLAEEKGDKGLSGQVIALLSRLYESSVDEFRHGRVILASRTARLFYIEPDWTRKNLLPLFDWEASEQEAARVWAGFLWQPRLNRPLAKELGAFFLDTIDHYKTLDFRGLSSRMYQDHYATLLTAVALDLRDQFSPRELAKATQLLPADGLVQAARTLSHRLKKADVLSKEWDEHTKPYLREIWPKTDEALTPEVATNVGLLCLAAGEKFGEAFKVLRDWLTHDSNLRYLIGELHSTDLCEQSPQGSLDFLSVIVGEEVGWARYDLDKCLEKIRAAEPKLEKSAKFSRLRKLV